MTPRRDQNQAEPERAEAKPHHGALAVTNETDWWKPESRICEDGGERGGGENTSERFVSQYDCGIPGEGCPSVNPLCGYGKTFVGCEARGQRRSALDRHNRSVERPRHAPVVSEELRRDSVPSLPGTMSTESPHDRLFDTTEHGDTQQGNTRPRGAGSALRPAPPIDRGPCHCSGRTGHRGSGFGLSGILLSYY